MDAGQSLDVRQRFLEISDALLRPKPVFGVAEPDIKRHYAIWLESFWHGQQAREALDHQACASEQYQHERHNRTGEAEHATIQKGRGAAFIDAKEPGETQGHEQLDATRRH